MILKNEQIQARIRHFGKLQGLSSDAAICERSGFGNRSTLGKIDKLKSAPQVDTLYKFATGLGVRIEDLIYNKPAQANHELQRLYTELTEAEQTDIKDMMRGMVLRRKYDVDDSKAKNGGRKSRAA
jgi:transcriptional regulator with XRE-family HTH domain